jgi:hypothetical protein
MATIYGREADLEKVRADEAALRDAMQKFVAAHQFESQEWSDRSVQSPVKDRLSEITKNAKSVAPVVALKPDM